MKGYKELTVWQKAVDLAENIYRLTGAYPQEERYGLVNQMRRAAVSIPSNIAEGYNRNTTKDYVQFLHISKGSNAELETQLIISRKMNYISEAQFNEMQGYTDEIHRMLSKMIKSLTQNKNQSFER